MWHTPACSGSEPVRSPRDTDPEPYAISGCPQLQDFDIGNRKDLLDQAHPKAVCFPNPVRKIISFSYGTGPVPAPGPPLRPETCVGRLVLMSSPSSFPRFT